MSFLTASKRRAALRLAITAGILAAVFASVDLRQVGSALASVDPGDALLALVATCAAGIILPSLSTRLILHTARIEMTLLELIKLNIAVRFYTVFMPRGVATGVRWYRYRKRGSGHEAGALIAFQQMLSIGVAVLSISLFLGLERHGLPVESEELWWISLLLSSGMGVALLPFLSSRFSGILHRLLLRFETRLPPRIFRMATRIWKAVTAYHQLRPAALGMLLLLALLAYCGFIFAGYYLARGMSLSIPLIGIAWMRSAVFLMTLFPLTIGGLGLREAGFVAFMHLYGVAAPEALGYALLLFAMQVVIALAGALLELWDFSLRPATAVRRRKSSKAQPQDP